MQLLVRAILLLCSAEDELHARISCIVALLEAHLTNTSWQYCGQQCQQKFPVVPVPGKQTVYDLICRFR